MRKTIARTPPSRASGGTTLLYWIIAAAVLAAACAGLACLCVRLRRRAAGLAQQLNDGEAMRRELRALQEINARRLQDAGSLRRALQSAQDHAAALKESMDDLRSQLRYADQRAQSAEARRIAADRDAAAANMRATLLENQLDRLQKEQAEQEQIYQDILREREDELSRLREAHRPRTRRKAEVLDQQISLDELLGGADPSRPNA